MTTTRCDERWGAASAGLTAVGAVWAAVAVISVFAPDLVSGSEHEHLPVAAVATWVWGLVATSAVARTVGRAPSPAALRPLATAVGTVWLVAAAVAVAGPVLVTGSDPTRVPVAAMVAPVGAALVTRLVCDLLVTPGGTVAPWAAPTRRPSA
ncbi:MAG TPA: hypothetical protein VGB14_03395 [Acidimicrobiales bacterium]|jgi:hypothetical protein